MQSMAAEMINVVPKRGKKFRNEARKNAKSSKVDKIRRCYCNYHLRVLNAMPVVCMRERKERVKIP